MLPLILTAMLAGPMAQDPTPAPAGGAQSRPSSEMPPSLETVRFDERTHWPIYPAAPRPRQPALGTGLDAGAGPGSAGADAAVPPAAPGGAAAAGPRHYGVSSPLVPVFETVRSPGTFRALGGVTLWWRVHLYSPDGEVIGYRELTHEADLAHPARDRIRYPDGRVYGRNGAAVFATLHGVPRSSLVAAAAQELELLGALLRLPWVFADAERYAVLPPDYVSRAGARLTRIRIDRLGEDDGVHGPRRARRAGDRFELLCDPSTGFPKELGYRLASTGARRRILLENFKEVTGARGGGNARISWRRVFVDADGKPSMVFEILSLEVEQQKPASVFRS